MLFFQKIDRINEIGQFLMLNFPDKERDKEFAKQAKVLFRFESEPVDESDVKALNETVALLFQCVGSMEEDLRFFTGSDVADQLLDTRASLARLIYDSRYVFLRDLIASSHQTQEALERTERSMKDVQSFISSLND